MAMVAIDLTYISAQNTHYPKQLVTVANGATFIALVLPVEIKAKVSNIIYMHVHRESRKCYVGITVQAAGKRWLNGTAYRYNRRFGSALKRHGWEMFDSFVLAFGDDRNALNQAEVAAISAAGGHKSKFTYNLSPGGELVAENDKPIIGVFLATGEERLFKSGTDAARKLEMTSMDMPMAVARGTRASAAGWWFRFKYDELATPPKSWGEELRIDAMRSKWGKRVIAINYATGERRLFSTTAEAAAALGVEQSAVSMVAQGKDSSAKGWWFRFEDDDRPMPLVHGSQAIRLKLDKHVYAVHLITGERRDFRNCSVADSELGLYNGATASVASGDRTSAANWWFSYDKDIAPPLAFKSALVAIARSKAVVAIEIATGREQQFDSAKDAASALGMSRAAISCVISGKLKTAKGYRFRFAKPEEVICNSRNS